MKVLKWLDKHFEETLLVFLLVAIACISMIQVIFRKLPFVTSLTWAEEFCRFLWIWSVFLSLPYTIRMGNMLRVGVLIDMLPKQVKNTINILVDIVNTACMGFFAYYSIGLVEGIKRSKEASPAMLWPMWLVYIFMNIGFFLAVIRGVQQIIIHVKNFHKRELTTLEQTMQDAAKEAAMAQEGGDE